MIDEKTKKEMFARTENMTVAELQQENEKLDKKIKEIYSICNRVMTSHLRTSEVVGRHVNLTQSGKNFTGICPFHVEKSPSFSVSDKHDKFYCFGCGATGDMTQFLLMFFKNVVNAGKHCDAGDLWDFVASNLASKDGDVYYLPTIFPN